MDYYFFLSKIQNEQLPCRNNSSTFVCVNKSFSFGTFLTFEYGSLVFTHYLSPRIIRHNIIFYAACAASE